MAVTIHRQPFSKVEREVIADAIMTGAYADELPELVDIALTIAERLPELLRKSGMPDNDQNRRRLIELVLVRWGTPKGPRPSRSYRKLARR